MLQHRAAVVQVIGAHAVGLGLAQHLGGGGTIPLAQRAAGAAPRRRVAAVVEQVLQAACRGDSSFRTPISPWHGA